MEGEPVFLDMSKLYISSSDTLRGTPTDQTVADGWNDRPPLFVTTDDDDLLKGVSKAVSISAVSFLFPILVSLKKSLTKVSRQMIRQGVPPALRCAVWISSTIKACHDHEEYSYAGDYRTLGKVRALDHAWEIVLKQMFPNESDVRDALPPSFGNIDHLQYHGDIPENGKRALTHVLLAIQHLLGLDFGPLLPPLAAICLRSMSESYAFYTLREMTHNSSWYFPVTQVEHFAWCKAFADVLTRLHPLTAAAMEKNGSLSPQGLDPIFKHFFLPILPYDDVLRIMDIYTFEGFKVIFRFGVALLCLFKMVLKDCVIDDSAVWWAELYEYTHSPHFDFEVLIKKAYGFHGDRLRKRLRFPRRHILSRIIKMEEDKVREECVFEMIDTPPRPLGLVNNDVISLAKPAHARQSLAGWLPLSLRLNKMDLIYSTNVHGRTLDLFYRHVGKCRHTILLAEVLNNNSVIGMFASQAWRVSSQVYGDGECFLFRISPDAKCWKWKPEPKSLIEEEDSDENTALLEQFMVGRESFISMGGNQDGTSGFRINEDFTKGESAVANGFHNDPLPMLDNFEIGLVEVYRLVSAVDGKSVEESAAAAFHAVK